MTEVPPDVAENCVLLEAIADRLRVTLHFPDKDHLDRFYACLRILRLSFAQSGSPAPKFTLWNSANSQQERTLSFLQIEIIERPPTFLWSGVTTQEVHSLSVF